jgi:hypothetical protein
MPIPPKLHHQNDHAGGAQHLAQAVANDAAFNEVYHTLAVSI